MSLDGHLYCAWCKKRFVLPSHYQGGKYGCPLCRRPLQFVSTSSTSQREARTEKGGESQTRSHSSSLSLTEKTLPPGSQLVTATGETFEVVSVLGRGGEGIVYEVRDSFLKRSMALKLLLAKKAKDPLAKARFLREIQVTAHLEHPNIIPVYEAGMLQDGSLYLLMKKIGGGTLKELLEAGEEGGRKVSLRKLLEIFLKVCQALQYAHSKGVIHRDLKPSNIAVGEFGEVLVMDWGLAKVQGKQELPVPKQFYDLSLENVSLEGSVLGTPAYMPPEQAKDPDLVSPRSDIYSLGAVLYHILALVPPYQGTPREILVQLLLKSPMPPRKRRPSLDIPKELDAICQKAMAKEPEDRYSSVGELVADIENYLEDKPIQVYTPPWRERVVKWMRRNVHLVGFATLLFLVVALFGTALAIQTKLRNVEHQKTIQLQKKLLEEEKAKEKLFREKLEAEKAKLEQQKRLLKIQKQKEEFQRRKLRAYSPFILARNLMAHNLRYHHLEKHVVPLLKEAIRIHPQFVEARLELIRVYIYLSYHQQLYSEILALAKNLPDPQGEGKRFMSTFQKFANLFFGAPIPQGAEQKLLKELETSRPSFIHPVYWSYLKLYFLYVTRKPRLLLKLIEDVAKTREGKSWEVYYMKGVALYDLGDFDRAIPIFKELIRKYPHIPYAYCNLAMCYRQKGMWEQAFSFLYKAVHLDPTNPFVWGQLGYFYQARGLNQKRGVDRLRDLLAALLYFSYAVEVGQKAMYRQEFLKNAQWILHSLRLLSPREKVQGIVNLFQRFRSHPGELRKNIALLFLYFLLKHPQDFRSFSAYLPSVLDVLDQFYRKYPQAVDVELYQNLRALYQKRR